MEIIKQSTICERLTRHDVFKHPDLDLVCLGGSNSSGSNEKLSDIDITTLMKPDNPKALDIKAIIDLGLQLREFVHQETSQGLVPIVIATIRLEEAQIGIAEILNPGKTIVPIHWLHYPSVEFAAINEPPQLVEGLFAGSVIRGNSSEALQRFRNVRQEDFKCLAGLDWLTDSFRVLITNISHEGFQIRRQSDSFLKKLAMHNLEYFWKWSIVRKIIEENTSQTPDNWKSMEELSSSVPRDIWGIANTIRATRHEIEHVSVSDIVKLHEKTFDILKS